MAKTLHLKFDPNQDYQHDAINAVVDLFDGFPRQKTDEVLSAEIIANLPRYDSFDTKWLNGNLQSIQARNAIPQDGLFSELVLDEGMMLEDVSDDSHASPHFTIEMETGTGKTYVYLRTMYELYARYGFRKFIIVVPSIAIYEGVRKTFEITKSHFAQLYEGTFVAPIAYDGAQLSKLRDFATSTLPTCLILTLDSFNKKTNTLYRPSEKLPGERLPFHYIQEARPIIILDEPQNMESSKAQEAIRTLCPLFVLRYSATHRTSPNLVYRLTPFEAFRRGLVKRIEVDGVTEQGNLNEQFFDLREIKPNLTAVIRTRVNVGGQTRTQDVVVSGRDDLYRKTGRDEHRGYVVEDINLRDNCIEFTNGERFYLNDDLGVNLTKATIFRAQIRATIERHMERQQGLLAQGVKVLSLFFIDRVANYTAPDGMIRRIFDEEFDRLKTRYPTYQSQTAQEVREAYFAKKRGKKDDTDEAIDTDSRNQTEREAEKAAFELIMRDKERLLRLDEPVAFIFAHSALKEGWDNPNVFQICTLNQTLSEVKKRQEIGRGLRLCVNQDGDRLFDETLNILTVVANESYSSYVQSLQNEYREDGVSDAPPAPTKAKQAVATRNDVHFNSPEFAAFWDRLSKQTRYHVKIDTPKLIKRCVERLDNATYPTATIVVEHGEFLMTKITLKLLAIRSIDVQMSVEVTNTNGEGHQVTLYLRKDDIGKKTGIEFLRKHKIMEINGNAATPNVVLENGITLYQGVPFTFERETVGQRPAQRTTAPPEKQYPVFDLIGRAARETDLTRPTINAIFSRLSDKTKAKLLKNPEGFSNVFINLIRDELSNHIVEHLEFEIVPDANGLGLESLFPSSRPYPQRELIEAGQRGLYDRVQKDSDVEERFVLQRLKDNEQVLFYFKFPPAFKINLPRIIGNYNPDWGIVYQDQDRQLRLQLVRETKGSAEIEHLQFANEGRKIRCAEKHFKTIGVDYRHITDETVDWWHPAPQTSRKLTGME
jgi:type III restriction enzyme